MINHRSTQNLKVDILAGIAESLECDLVSERNGLSFLYGDRTSRWVQMDPETCALIINISSMVDLSFDIGAWRLECFHSLYIMKGNVGFGGFEKNGYINLRPDEFLFFHSKSQTLEINIKGGQRCQLVFISHSFPSIRDLRFLLPEKNNLLFGRLERKSRSILTEILGESSEIGPKFLLKGQLFELLGGTLPQFYAHILKRRTHESHNTTDLPLPISSKGRDRYLKKRVSVHANNG